MAHEKHTFCRICEPNCPIVAEFGEDGEISRLKPNLEHPSGGVACHKGLSFLDVHNDPDRLNWPRKRLNARLEDRGDFATISWDVAMAEIGQRIRDLREKHGHNAVAVYLGNPFAFNGSALLMAAEFQNLLDTQMRFSANTQDAANKFIALGAVYGAAEAVMIPDFRTYRLPALSGVQSEGFAMDADLRAQQLGNDQGYKAKRRQDPVCESTRYRVVDGGDRPDRPHKAWNGCLLSSLGNKRDRDTHRLRRRACGPIWQERRRAAGFRPEIPGRHRRPDHRNRRSGNQGHSGRNPRREVGRRLHGDRGESKPTGRAVHVAGRDVELRHR